MRRTRALVGVAGVALAATSALVSTSTTASAEPSGPGAVSPADPSAATGGGRGAGTAARVEKPTRAQVAQQAAESAVAGDPIAMPTSYPYQPRLRFYRDNADDAAATAELITHPQIAPRLTELMQRSDRVSVQVVGQSTEGRDLYLVTLTAPETAEETARQSAWKNQMKADPEAAAADPALPRDYKTPIWISNNIHGNEWEGTDAAMDYIEHLATAPLSEVGGILANNRVYFSPSLNPDGRTNATRATALGLDPNRDMITNSTPETRSFIRQAQAIQPIYAADFHGYTRVLQMEPCGPPHGSNYEYDLTMPHNYALALKVEKDVVDADIPGNTYYDTTTGAVVPANTGPDTAHIKIPYRDTPDGWDDFPPIFTAQYAAFFGAASATVELPLTRGAAGGRQTPERAVVNTDVAYQTMESIVGYMNVGTTARDMISNQIETFRRGVAGEAKDNLTTEDVAAVPGPEQWKPLWDVVDDQDPIEVPRAYVIPVGEGQRSESDADRLVDQLLTHDVEVGTLTSDTTVDGTDYPAGSYVVDMHQPLRGLANSLLDLGEDISEKVPSMYDISAWSYSYTWGATVDKVGLTEDPAPVGDVEPIDAVPAGSSVPDEATYTTFDVAGVADHRLLNEVLEEDVPVAMLEDGSVVVDVAGFDVAAAAAEDLGITLEAASEEDLDALAAETTKPLSDLTVGYVGTQDDRLSLTELGFDDLVALSVTSLDADPTLLDGVDVLWVGGTFNPAVGSAAEDAVEAFVADGGSVTGRDASNGVFALAQRIGLLDGTVTPGNRSGNGIVDVDTPEGSVLAPYAQDSAFIYPAFSYSALGGSTTAAQTYGADPLLAGHWRATDATNGPAGAAGAASAVSAVDEETGSRTFVFGTSPLFRTHPKGGLSQAARALQWAGPEGEPVVAPGDSSVVIAPVGRVVYPGDATVEVTTAGDDETPADGTVELLVGDEVVASGATTDGAVSLTVEGLTPGTTSVVARFTPATPGSPAVLSAPADVRVTRAVSELDLDATEAVGKRARLVLDLEVAAVPTTGRVVLRDNGALLRTVRVTAGEPTVLRVALTRGRHLIKARFSGTDLVRGSADRDRVRIG